MRYKRYRKYQVYFYPSEDRMYIHLYLCVKESYSVNIPGAHKSDSLHGQSDTALILVVGVVVH